MKKTLLYMATAILLGVVMMLLPLMLLYTLPKEAEYGTLCKGYLEDVDNFKPTSITCPSSPLFIGLAFALSFVFALGVSIYVKIRIL